MGEGETRFEQNFLVNGIFHMFKCVLLLLANDLFDIFDRMTANIYVLHFRMYIKQI